MEGESAIDPEEDDERDDDIDDRFGNNCDFPPTEIATGELNRDQI